MKTAANVAIALMVIGGLAYLANHILSRVVPARKQASLDAERPAALPPAPPGVVVLRSTPLRTAPLRSDGTAPTLTWLGLA